MRPWLWSCQPRHRRLITSPTATPATLDGLVFTTPTGRPLDRKTVLTDLHSLCAAVGLPAIRFHDLRVVNATLLRSLGVDGAVIGQQLGHRTAQMTDRYAQVMPALQRAAAGRLDEALRAVGLSDGLSNGA